MHNGLIFAVRAIFCVHFSLRPQLEQCLYEQLDVSIIYYPIFLFRNPFITRDLVIQIKVNNDAYCFKDMVIIVINKKRSKYLIG